MKVPPPLVPAPAPTPLPVARRTAVASGVALLLLVALLAIPAAAGWAPLQRVDGDVVAVAVEATRGVPGGFDLVRLLTRLGDTWLVMLVAAALATALVAAGRVRDAVFVVAVRVVSAVASPALKAAIDRDRPVVDEPLLVILGASYPSGHATGAAALWLSVAVVLHDRLPRWAAVVIGIGIPVVVAATRVLLGVHHPSDVVAGLALGAACCLLPAALLLPERRP